MLRLTHWPNSVLLLLITQLLMSMFDEAHWASDVWIGAAMAIATARFVHGRHEPGAQDPTTAFTPVVAPDGRPGIAFVGRF